jgi:hypothetical protein
VFVKFKPSLAHLCAISAILSAIAVIKGASIGDALVIIGIQAPFLLKTFVDSRKIEDKTPEIQQIELETRKQQLQMNLDNLKYQHVKELTRRDAEAGTNGQQRQFIF